MAIDKKTGKRIVLGRRVFWCNRYSDGLASTQHATEKEAKAVATDQCLGQVRCQETRLVKAKKPRRV